MGLTRNFLTTIRNSEQALDIAKDGGEVAIDAMLANEFGTDGVLKDIPILNIVVSLCKAGNKITAYFFAKNMMAFIAEVDKVPPKKRMEFLDKNCADEAGVENVGEVALMILDKLDHPRLAAMLGRAFALMAIGTISIREFNMYAHIIKAMNPYIIEQLTQVYKYEGMIAIDLPAARLLASYGLMTVGTMLNRTGNTSLMELNIEKTGLGQTFYERIIIGRSSY